MVVCIADKLVLGSIYRFMIHYDIDLVEVSESMQKIRANHL
jgi:hypothetical protein